MTTWVLLRGLVREQRHWGRFPEVLRQHLPVGSRIVALDLPGNGSRWREQTPLAIGAALEQVRSELHARGHAPPYCVLALSMGGMVALQWARQAPQELEACVLVNSSAGNLSAPWRRLRPSCWPAILRWLLSRSPVAKERAVLTATSNQPVDEDRVAAWARFARERPVRWQNALRQVIAAARFQAPASLAVRTLLLASRGDRVVSPLCSAQMASAWRLPLREHAWAAHDLPLDDPAWVAAAVSEWIHPDVTELPSLRHEDVMRGGNTARTMQERP